MIIKTELTTAWKPCDIYILIEVLQTRWQHYAEQQEYVFPAFTCTYESLFYEAREEEDHNDEFKKSFQERMRTCKCFTMDGSKMENKPFISFISTDIKDGCCRKFRITKIASTFTAQALAIGKTLEIIKKIHLAQLHDFLGLSKCVKRY